MTQLVSQETLSRPEDQLQRKKMEALADEILPEFMTKDLLGLIQEKDDGTYHHSLETMYVAYYSAIMLGWPEGEARITAVAAAVHDIGKVVNSKSLEFINSSVVLGDTPEERALNPAADHDRDGADYLREWYESQTSIGRNFSSEERLLLESAIKIANGHHTPSFVEDRKQMLVILVDRLVGGSDGKRFYVREKNQDISEEYYEERALQYIHSDFPPETEIWDRSLREVMSVIVYSTKHLRAKA